MCKQITRLKYVKWDGTWRCFTCGSIIDEPAKAQTGHCIPSATGGVQLRYNLDNLRVQDYRCNINLGGNGAIYITRLRLEIGDERVDKLLELQGQELGRDILLYLEELIEEYKKTYADLKRNPSS